MLGKKENFKTFQLYNSYLEDTVQKDSVYL